MVNKKHILAYLIIGFLLGVLATTTVNTINDNLNEPTYLKFGNPQELLFSWSGSFNDLEIEKGYIIQEYFYNSSNNVTMRVDWKSYNVESGRPLLIISHARILANLILIQDEVYSLHNGTMVFFNDRAGLYGIRLIVSNYAYSAIGINLGLFDFEFNIYVEGL